jgi:phosphatidylserine/phosphatidylglycerophosphate/cardiolipin synthase-like enzyme
VKLILQPEDGIDPILQALGQARKRIQILIFRIDRTEVEKALTAAVERGVLVQALVACTNRGGEKTLRKCETRLLEKGVTVTRTAGDLLRYHGKMFIIDGKELYLLAFNYTHLDIALSRSFGVSTRDPALVAEAAKLFECDVKRTPYRSTNDELIVSPVNAREQLTKFIAGAKRRLLIYDMKISDRAFLKLLNEKVSAGVDVRVIGRASTASLPTRALPMRLHARVILRDDSSAFIGSQSLRKLELEVRREIGIIFHDRKIVKQMMRLFEKDWSSAAPAADAGLSLLLESPAKKVAKVVAKRLDVEGKVEEVLEKAAENQGLPVEPELVVESIREAVRDEVQQAVVHAVRELVTEAASPNKETPATGNGAKP